MRFFMLLVRGLGDASSVPCRSRGGKQVVHVDFEQVAATAAPDLRCGLRRPARESTSLVVFRPDRSSDGDAERTNLLSQGAARDAQNSGGLDLIAVGLLQ